MSLLNTVKIDDGHGGYIIINETDFNEKIHKLFIEKQTTPRASKPKE